MASTMLTLIFLLSTLVIAEGISHFKLDIPMTDVWASSLFYTNIDGLAFASRAMDGNYDTDYYEGSTFASSGGDFAPYFDIFMDGLYEVFSVTITNRGDSTSDLLHDIDVLVYNDNPLTSGEVAQKCGQIGAPPAAGSNTTVFCSDNPTGYFIRIKKTVVNNSSDILQFVEVSVDVEYPNDCLK